MPGLCTRAANARLCQRRHNTGSKAGLLRRASCCALDHLVLDYRDALPVVLCQDVVQQRRFPGSQEPRDNLDREASRLCVSTPDPGISGHRGLCAIIEALCTW